jgi:hypothetical protein
MKKLAVTIKLELVIPDDWELVQTSEGVEVLKMSESQFLDLTFEPMVTDDKEGQWSNAVDDDFMDNLLDMVETEDVTYKIITN